MSISARDTAVYHNSVFAMNTRLDVVFWGGEQSTFEIVFQKMANEVEDIELTISRYHSASELFRLNQTGFLSPVEVSEKLMNAILLAATYNEQTNGYFDVSMGTAFHKIKNGEEFEYSTVERISDRVSIDSTKQTLQYLQPNVSLDFGGMGKGMALKAIAEIIDKHDIKNAFISFGGSSVLTRGRHPHGEHWPFSLAVQKDHVWQLNNDCISVSSSHRKVNGTKELHILNPFQSEIETIEKTVVVQTENPVDAEVLSTTLIAAPEEEHSKILANFRTAKHFILKPI